MATPPTASIDLSESPSDRLEAFCTRLSEDDHAYLDLVQGEFGDGGMFAEILPPGHPVYDLIPELDGATAC